MSRKKVSTTIYITPEQAERLKLLHERTKVPIAVFIREGIDLMLKHYEPVLPGQMSLESATQSPSPPAVVASSAPSAPSRRDAVREPVATLRTGTSGTPGSSGVPSS
jgi:Ribbon-helix-helix domain